MTSIGFEAAQASPSFKVAALRAYNELRDSGALDKEAFNAAVRVLKYHRPDVHSR